MIVLWDNEKQEIVGYAYRDGIMGIVTEYAKERLSFIYDPSRRIKNLAEQGKVHALDLLPDVREKAVVYAR